MNEPHRVSVSGLRLSLAAVLNHVERGERFTVTRDGEPVAALVSPDDAAWCALQCVPQRCGQSCLFGPVSGCGAGEYPSSYQCRTN